ncbi:MAG: electron transfer flavoprotein subunit alpha/FixB family protein [Candidatus Delongbacteria bacterium]
MNIVCLIEQTGGLERGSAREALGLARRLADAAGGQVTGLVLGSLRDPAALGGWGAHRVVELPALDGPGSSDAWSAGLAEALGPLAPDLILLSASASGRELGPRLAARLGTGLVAECTELAWQDGQWLATRPIFAGKVLVTAPVAGKPALVSLRAKVFAVQEGGPAAHVEQATLAAREMQAVVEEILAAAGGKLDLSEADIIVSGGRGVGGPEGFAPLEELAAKLGAAVGASRAAVDAGWRPHSQQVGQTGKVVNPTLYIACGISGAIQHLAGMKNSRYIVAINKDPEAPIFKLADYGIVGDLFEVVPALSRALA